MARARDDQSLLERMVTAVDRVRDRLARAAAALEAGGAPYAIIGGNAVAAWVGIVDPGAVRTTADVDVLLRRADLGAATVAMSAAGFVPNQTSGIDRFLDGPDAGPRDAVHVIIANEKVKPRDLVPAPDVSESVRPEAFRLVTLGTLVQMKLASFRRKDQVHPLDVGLIDATWPARYPADLAARLRQLIDTPED